MEAVTKTMLFLVLVRDLFTPRVQSIVVLIIESKISCYLSVSMLVKQNNFFKKEEEQVR